MILLIVCKMGYHRCEQRMLLLINTQTAIILQQKKTETITFELFGLWPIHFSSRHIPRWFVGVENRWLLLFAIGKYRRISYGSSKLVKLIIHQTFIMGCGFGGFEPHQSKSFWQPVLLSLHTSNAIQYPIRFDNSHSIQGYSVKNHPPTLTEVK